MFRRGAFFFVVLCLAVGIPYASTEWGQVSHLFSGSTSTSAETPADGTPSAAAAAVGLPLSTPVLGGVTPGAPTADLPPIVDLGEALRFDVTNSWILGRWPRVTTGLPDENMQGYRVPLVTGTGEDDLAGSLTYYFNTAHRCRRITFQGTTGDARKLINLLTTHYGFVQQKSSEPGLYVYQIRWNGRATSELHVRPARVVRASIPMGRFEVLLAMNDPNAG